MDKPGKTVRKKRPRRTFTPAFKAEAVRLCRVGDRNIAQVAKDLDLTETALREWVHRADVDAGKGPAGALTSDERAELARLRREIKQLQIERPPQSVIATACLIINAGVLKPSVCRGRPLSLRATRSSSVCVKRDRSVPLGKYCRKSRFVFSFVPRCHGLCGSQK
jgi:transposase